jgi:hypothetical protein
MARRRASAATNLQHAARMRQHQPRRVPIHTNPPFLHEPANFGSPRTRQQLTRSQAGQIIPIPGVHPLGWTGMRLFNWPSAGRVPLQS